MKPSGLFSSDLVRLLMPHLDAKKGKILGIYLKLLLSQKKVTDRSKQTALPKLQMSCYLKKRKRAGSLYAQLQILKFSTFRSHDTQECKFAVIFKTCKKNNEMERNAGDMLVFLTQFRYYHAVGLPNITLGKFARNNLCYIIVMQLMFRLHVHVIMVVYAYVHAFLYAYF